MKIFDNHAPDVLTYKELKARGDTNLQKCPNSSSWIPARPYPFHDTFGQRLRAAWLVFTGRADALLPVWQSETLEDPLRKATRNPCKEGRHG